VEDVGSAVTSVKPGQFVIGSIFASDNKCPNCHVGYQSSFQNRELVNTAQAPLLRVPLADGTLVATPNVPSDDMVPSLLTLSDVMGTGWFAAHAANVKPGNTVVVVGDGAVGLLGMLSASQMGAERIIAMSRHDSRQKLAREFGATDIVTERGDEGVDRIKELTDGVGADSVLECVGTQESMLQAIRATRKGGHVGYVGVPHRVELNGEELFFAHVHLHGGPAPVRHFLPELIDLVWKGKINPGKVFELTLPLDQVAEGYRAMDERRAIHRREFLKVSIEASGGLLLGFRLAGAGETLALQIGSATSFTPNAFVRIGTDERVTVIVNHSEMGQGVYTSLPMLLAEELDADWNNVAFESAPVDPKYNHPVFGMQMTGGSSSVWSGFEQFRQAGAAARAMVIAAAAQQWNVDPSKCRTDSGAVFDPSNRKLTYGQLAAAAAKLTPPAQVPLKDPTTFKLIGKPAKRLDTSEKVNGRAVF